LIVIRLVNITVDNGLHLPADRSFGIRISGHAGDDIRGRDIVCAAVSALAQTLVLSINRLLDVEQAVKTENGFLTSTVNPVMDKSEEDKLKLLIESFLIGILEVQREYPERVKIDYEVG